MREILFRAKAINRDGGSRRTNYKNGDWVYGLIIKPFNEKFDFNNTKREEINIIDTDMLKPCPWCGGKPIIHSEKVNCRDRLGFDLTLECGECGSELRKQKIGGLYFEFSEDGFLTLVNEDIDEMIEQWNRRTPND